LFEPTSASDVAGALAILEATKTVRGGGHMPVPEAASIAEGVLISTENLNTMRLTDANTIAQLGPGLRWGAVYEWISQYNLGIVGGRYGPVGVPGLLLGGGINYFSSKYGWAANTVSNFEVVLANGTIVNANAQTNPDLFWALKGGSSNFGIVTRFDMRTFPVSSVYGGTTFYKAEYVDAYLDAIAAYVTPGGGSDDVLASFNPTLQLTPSDGSFTIYSLSSRLGNDPDPAAFANFSKIPVDSSSNSVRGSFSAFTNETASPLYGDRSNRFLPRIAKWLEEHVLILLQVALCVNELESNS
jgi:FAD/FMN-containing dehydrogenase